MRIYYRYLFQCLCTMALLASPLAVAFEETTDTKISDGEEGIAGGYTAQEMADLEAAGKEQKAILDKFMKGRYSTNQAQKNRTDGFDRRYSNILEKHDSNLDGITEHDGADNDAEKAGDIVGLGKAGLNGNDRLSAMVVQRIESSGNCELTKKDREALKNKDFNSVKGVVKGKTWTEKELLTQIFQNKWTRYVDKDAIPLPNLNAQDSEQADQLLKQYNDLKAKFKYVPKEDAQGKSTGYQMQCPNVSAVVLDKGPAHGGEEHRVYEISEKMFTPGTGVDGPFGASAKGEARKAADNYAAKVLDDSGRTAIPQEIIAAMRKRGMDVWTDAKGQTVYTKMPDGSIRQDKVEASYDDLKSEYAWLEHQKEHLANTMWKTLRLEEFAAGDKYDPANVSNEMGDLLAENAALSEKDRDKIAADKVAEIKAYDAVEVCLKVSGTGTSVSIDPPGPCPKAPATYASASLGNIKGNKDIDTICGGPGKGANCYLAATASELRDPQLSNRIGGGLSANKLTQVALDAAKQNLDPKDAAEIAKNKANISAQVQKCLAIDKWCKPVSLSQYRSLVDNPTELNKALNEDPMLKGKGITAADVKAGTAFVQITGDPGEAFQDTRQFIATRMEIAAKGPLSQFVNTVRSADFNEGTDAKTTTKPFAQMKKQWEINMKLAKEIQEYSRNAYQECLAAKGINCKLQFDKNNFDPNKMNTVQLFGRNTDRDGKMMNTTKTEINGELTRAEAGTGSNSNANSIAPRAPATAAPLPARGSAPANVSSPFSLN